MESLKHTGNDTVYSYIGVIKQQKVILSTLNSIFYVFHIDFRR